MSGELGESKDTRRVRASGRGPAPLGQLEASASSDWHALWHDNKEVLKQARRTIEEFVENELQCRLKPTLLNATSRGLPFLGYVVLPFNLRLSLRSRRRFVKKMRALDEKYRSGEWDEASCQRRALPLLAFTQHANAKAFRKTVFFG